MSSIQTKITRYEKKPENRAHNQEIQIRNKERQDQQAMVLNELLLMVQFL